MNMTKMTKPMEVPTIHSRGKSRRITIVARVQRTKSRIKLATCKSGRRRMLKKRRICCRKLS